MSNLVLRRDYVRKLLLCGLVCLLFVPIASFADTVLLDSRAGVSMVCSGGAGDCSLNSVLTVAVTAKNPAWADPFGTSAWVSWNAGTGAGGPTTQTSNGSVMTVSDEFNTGSFSELTLSVMADDTTSVMLSPFFTFPAASSSGNNYTTCSDFEIGCLLTTAGIFNVAVTPHTDLWLYTQTDQVAGSSFGLDYEVTAVPEPGSLMLFGSGLLGLAGMIRRRLRL
jgi:hypothetical protein